MSKTKEIDHLTEDDVLPNQQWVCVSFLSPEGIRNCNVRGLKIRGCYATREQADARAKQLQEMDPDFHVYVGEVGKWLPWNPDPNDVQDQVYQEKELQKIMEGYKENVEKAKKMHKQREQDAIKGAAADEQSRAKNVKDRLKAKLVVKQEKERVDELSKVSGLQKGLEQLENSDSESDDESKKVEKEQQVRLDEERKRVEQQEHKVENIDAKLAKIQALYEKLNKN